ncbi:alpha/beta hydrolase [Plantibacter sp. CFBP 8804]|uniref:alpha/beta hydrolase n=1 Tax=Plantibacter sp. CFBP 8804 TaxID=2775270 RepID=UPI00177C3623|nr:dienelactone hydrolase family protein [Plantibacter sp. CFBP 8804]MBD8517932.1 dienelactone hydrolase family protein [Plantibacter sp. CFBP 8804]
MTTALRDVRSADWADAVSSAPVVAVLLHGYGSNEHDLTGLVGPLALGMPWVSLRAPLEMGHGGAAWFEITTPGNPDPEPIARATDAVWDWIDEHVPAEARIVPIGFSQGGFMASQLLRTRPERVVAPVILAGFVLSAPQPGDEVLAATKPAVFWGRGLEDRVIAAPAVARTHAWLPLHTTLTERTYPGLAHGIHQAEIDDVRTFLGEHVG